MSLTERQIEILVNKMNSERTRIVEAFKNESLGFKAKDGSDEVDQANADYERSQMLRFRSRDQFYIKKLDKALQKVSEQEYGICEECDETIRFERLLARPTAELCITCKDEAEREEGSSMIGRKSKSLTENINLSTSM